MVKSKEKTERTLRQYIEQKLHINEDLWKIDTSIISGRGLFATKDLQPGDVVFHDIPVTIGPRLKSTEPFCVSCYKTGTVITCEGGCRLPVCSKACSLSSQHTKECQFLKANLTIVEDGTWSKLLVQALTAFRCLLLEEEDKEVVRCLQGLSEKHYCIEVDILRKYLGSNLTLQDQQWIKLCCLAMDCNAFEALSGHQSSNKKTSTSLKGLYPLAAIMNHNCSPNTYHTYNNECVMIVRAAKLIKKGEEITTSYTSLLWNTTVRRNHLQKTKQFLCECERCRDPTEFGSMLSAINCPNCTNGLILPKASLKSNSSWTCNTCFSDVLLNQVNQLHLAQGTILGNVNTLNPRTVLALLHGKIPLSKQLTVQLKIGLIWQIGHSQDYFWEELTTDLLDLKEIICNELLNLIDELQLGECRIKGLVLFELYCTICEKHKKCSKEKTNEFSGVKSIELRDTLAKVLDMFSEDASAPQEIYSRLKDYESKNSHV